MNRTAPGIRVAELRSTFLDGLSFHTRRAYETDLDTYLGWCRERAVDPLANDLDVRHFERYRAWLEATPHSHGQRADTTVHRMLAAVSAWYTRVVAPGTDHPVRELARPAQTPRHRRKRTELDPDAICGLVEIATPWTWPPRCAHLTMHLRVDLALPVTRICALDLSDLTSSATPDGALSCDLHVRSTRGRTTTISLPDHVAQLAGEWLTDRVARPGDQALLVDIDRRRITEHRVAYLTSTLAARATAVDHREP